MPIMPTVFFGHGNPMNALQHNSYTERWAQIGSALPRPKAILCVRALVRPRRCRHRQHSPAHDS